MTRMTAAPNTTSWPWAEPMTGTLLETFGSSPTNAAPTRTPQSEPRPATAAPIRISSESRMPNSLGYANPLVARTNSEPATPQNAAEMPNASVL